MGLRRLACLLALLAMVPAAAAEAGGETPMRSRVFIDAEAGISFRYPYDYVMPDQYVGEFCRLPPAGAQDAKGDGRPAVEARVFSHPAGRLPGGLGADAELSALGDREAGAALAWQPLDYYRDPAERPFAARGWAPPGVQAALGEGASGSVLVVRHGDRLSGLVLRGGAGPSAANRGLIDSFEVLSTGEKASAKPAAGRGPRAMTWREAQCRKGQVIDAQGALAKAAKGKPVPWSGAWEVETEHYHLTGNRDPELLLRRSAYYEALYRAYSGLFQPERLPPVKSEVHIFDTADQFEAGARQWIDPAFEVRHDGAFTGGFFAPGLLSLWVYEESVRLGGEAFSVEHVSAHECSHQFMHLACNGSRHIPTWINEGVAVYFEAGVVQRGEFAVRPPSERIDRLRTVYADRKATLMPLGQYLDHRGPISADQYGEVFAMTHFWLFGTCSPSRDLCRHRDCGLKRFREYWQALKKGEDGGQAFERIFLRDMIRAQGGRQAAIDAWSRALMEYVAKRLR